MPIVQKIPVHVDAIPEEIRALPRWACWREVPSADGKKPGKPPINATVAFSGKHVYAKPNDPTTWASFDVAKQYMEEHVHIKGGKPACGLSFCVNGDGIIGIDLDDCRNPLNMSISEWAAKIVERFASYTEISPSGRGIRIFLRGTLPPQGRHKGKIEVYDTNKFLSVTGRKLTICGAGDAIEDRSAELLAWHREVFGDGARSTKESSSGGESIILNAAPQIDQDRLGKLFQAKPKAEEIVNGRWHGYASQSEADLALANYAAAAGWTDQEICDLLVLARLNAGEDGAKLERLDYYTRTIAKAREGRKAPTPAAKPEAKTAFRKSQGEGIGTLSESFGGRVSALDEVRGVFKKYLYFSDEHAIDVVLGVVAGNEIDTDPIWLHLVSAPSSGKTELLMSIFGCPEAYFLSDFTANSLISGYKDPPELDPDAKKFQKPDGKDDYSLLPELNGKVLVTKDFTLIYEKPSETRAQLLAILRDAYDGFASRKTGNQDTKSFKARFNYLTGMTPDLEKAWSLNTLGERFLIFRVQIADRREHAKQALKNVLDREKGASKVRQEIQDAVSSFMKSLKAKKPATPTVGDEMLERILDLADILSTCRTYVYRDKNDEIPCLPQAELASRVGKQLMRLGQSVALVRGKAEVTADEFKIMKRIALDSLPTNRRLLLTALWEHRTFPEPLATFADKVSRISKTTVRRELDNLAELGAVNRETELSTSSGGKQTERNVYQLTANFIRMCDAIEGIPTP